MRPDRMWRAPSTRLALLVPGRRVPPPFPTGSKSVACPPRLSAIGDMSTILCIAIGEFARNDSIPLGMPPLGRTPLGSFACLEPIFENVVHKVVAFFQA